MNKEMLCKRILSIVMGILFAMSMFMFVSIDAKATTKVIRPEDNGAGELVVSEDYELRLLSEYGNWGAYAFYGSGILSSLCYRALLA